ncbi:hypothetical protein [Streptomyces sp. NPDC047990]|uniref:hypothetical protein n=1 Tax=Streptomyces sp. NPDC047990 TaxID=3365496 RepID=UPI00371EB729
MSLSNLATAADLEAYLQRGPLNADAADVALRIASAAIRRFTRQTITFVENETVLLEGGERVLKLPQRPVTVNDLHPLTVMELPDGSGVEVPAVEGRDFVRQGSELQRGQPYYAATRTMGYPWGRPLGIWAGQVRVTYSHGYQEIPDDIVGVCLDLAAATLSNPNRLRSEGVGGESVTYTVETFGTGSLTSDHRRLLRGFRCTLGSVTLR